MSDGRTCDAFLDGKVVITQPAEGYRAATDPVILAASVPAQSGQAVLDLGCGVGTAALCLGARVPGVVLSGLELQTDYAALAEENASANGQNIRVFIGDLADPPAEFRQESFDHVMTNPPFFEAHSGTQPTNEGKELAHHETMDLGDWIAAGLKRLSPKGSFTLIHRAERLGAILDAMEGPCGAVIVQPIAPRMGRAANRVIVQGIKGARAKTTLAAPVVMHQGASHREDGDDFSEFARGVLRAGEAINLRN